MTIKQITWWVAGSFTLTLGMVLLQGPLAQPEGTAFALVSGIRDRQIGKVRSVLVSERWNAAFEENPEGFFSAKSTQEPNLAALAGQHFTTEKVAETPSQQFSINQPCNKFLFCPERATVTYRLSFPEKQPYLMPTELVMGGWQRQTLREGQLKAYGENPASHGAIFLPRRLSMSALPTAMPLSVMNYKPDLSRLDPVAAKNFDKEQAGTVIAADGHTLSETEMAALLPRLSSVGLLVEVQRPDPFSPWKVAGFGLIDAIVTATNGQSVPLQEARYR